MIALLKTCNFTFSKAFKPRSAIKFKLIGAKPRAKAESTKPKYWPSAFEIPKKSVWVISGPKNKKAIELGIVMIPTKRIALTNWSWMSLNFFS